MTDSGHPTELLCLVVTGRGEGKMRDDTLGALGREIAAAYVSLGTGEPYIDEPATCSSCGGHGWYIGHEDVCYDSGDCSCSGVQVECECQRDEAAPVDDGIMF